MDALGRRSRSFLGSSFLRDQAHDAHYLLIEYWSEMVVYEKHRTSFVADLRTLEERRDEFCESIVPRRHLLGARYPRSLRPDLESPRRSVGASPS